MLSLDFLKRPSADEILTHYVPGSDELELKWEKVQHKALNMRVKELEILEKNLQERRKSF